MIPSARASGTRAALWAAAGVALLLLAAQVAGMVFLAVLGASPVTASPLTLPRYAIYYGAAAPIQTALWVGVAGGLMTIVSPALWLLWPAAPRALHGEARWATRADIRRAGLLNGRGIIVGKARDGFLQHDGSAMASPHVFLAAPTGSGKTQGVMLPNALAWPGSLVVLDVKGELYAASAGYRAACGQRVVRLDFTSDQMRSDQYNPFAYVGRTPERLAGDVRRIADYLIPESVPEGMWSDNARNIFAAYALYFYGIGETPTLPRIRELLNTPEGPVAWCKNFLRQRDAAARHHRQCIAGFSQVANGPEETIGGILQSFHRALVALTSDVTAAVVSGNTFDLRALRTEPMSIFVTVQLQDREQLAPLLRLFCQQLIDVNMEREFSQLGPNAREVLIGLDEFAAIGRLPAIASAVPVVRAYGLRLLAIVQSPSQLVSLYGAEGARTLTDNFGCAVSYTPGPQDHAAAEELSRLLGYTTVPGRSVSRSRHEWMHGRSSVTTSDQRRALMLPQEIMTMAKDQVIVRVSGCTPIRAAKILAATDPVLRRRILPPPEAPVLKLAQPWQPALKPDVIAREATDILSTVERIAEALPLPNAQHEASAAEFVEPRTTIAPDRTELSIGSSVESATALALDSLDDLRLEDFALDFESVQVPSKPITPDEATDFANRIFGVVKAPNEVTA